MRGTYLTVLSVLFLGCGAEQRDAADGWHDPSPHSARTLPVAPDVTVEVLDWGGQGPPVVLLAGLGNTAHVFDDFAPTLTDSFRVLGLTRRGFGRSTQPPSDHVDTLVADLKVILDSLRLGPVILIGHSIAGEEMTAFAASHPRDCRALIYLDAAYDRSGLPALMQQNPLPAPPAMTSADSASPAALRQYLVRALGLQVPEAEVRAFAVFDSSGRYRRDVTPDSIAYGIAAHLKRPDYTRVQCPSLAIYSSDSIQVQLPYYATLDSAGQSQANRAFLGSLRFRRDGIAQYRRETKNGSILELYNAQHYIFGSHPREVLQAVRSFLAAR